MLKSCDAVRSHDEVPCPTLAKENGTDSGQLLAAAAFRPINGFASSSHTCRLRFVSSG